jgi:phospholipid/cholesterol/gamma-HCH transport system substrate-binding protein
VRRDNINYLAVGTFVLLAVGALVVVLVLISGRRGPTDSYHVVYRNVAGIKPGTAVLYEGYQIGQVVGLAPRREPEGMRYRVDLSVQRGWPIPQDSLARIEVSGLLSAVSIDIRGGEARALLSPGATLRGKEAVDLFASLNSVASDAHQIVEQGVRPLLGNLNRSVDEIGTTIQAGATTLFADLRALAAKLNQSAESLRKTLDQDNRKELASILANANAMSQKLLLVSKNIERLTGSVDGLLSNVNGLVSENRESLRASVRDLQSSMHLIAQRIDSVSHNLDGASRNLNEFGREIRENPALLLGTSRPKERTVR